MFREINKFCNLYSDVMNNAIKGINKDELINATNLLILTFQKNKMIFTCGNGGSASTASHIVNDFSLMFGKDFSPRFKMRSLCDNISSIMAISNDISYEDCFVNQLIGVLNPCDLVLGISGSGNSKNVVKVFEYAKIIGANSLAFVGYDGGIIKKNNIADFIVHIPINDMQKVEDIHMALFHMLMQFFIFNKEEILKGLK